jgi:hypothetical protein
MRPYDKQLERQEDDSPDPVIKVDGEEPEVVVNHGSEETPVVIKQEDGDQEATVLVDEQHAPGSDSSRYNAMPLSGNASSNIIDPITHNTPNDDGSVSYTPLTHATSTQSAPPMKTYHAQTKSGASIQLQLSTDIKSYRGHTCSHEFVDEKVLNPFIAPFKACRSCLDKQKVWVRQSGHDMYRIRYPLTRVFRIRSRYRKRRMRGVLTPRHLPLHRLLRRE